MPTITLKNIPEELYRRIKESAAREQRSINRQILYTLDRSLAPQEVRDPEGARSATPSFPPLTEEEILSWKNRE